MQHLEEGTIHAWLDGALDDLEAARVARHAEECKECAAMVAEARGLIAGASRIVSSLDVVRGGVIPQASGRDQLAARRGSLWGMLRLSPPRAAIAATVLVAVGSMLAVREVGRDSSVRARSSAVMDAPAAKPEAAPAPAAPLASRIDSLSASPPSDLRDEARSRERAAKVATANESQDKKIKALEKQTVGRAGAVQVRENQVATSVASAAPPVVAPTPAAPVPATGRIAGAAAAADAMLSARQRVATDSAALRAADSIRLQRIRADSVGLRMEAAPVAQVRALAERPRKVRDEASAAAGCYSILSALPPWAASIPRRFALDVAPADSAPQRRAVRTLSDGRMDSAIPRASWRMLPDSGDRVRFAVEWQGSGGLLTLTFSPLTESDPRGGAVTISDPTHSQTIMLARFACSPR
jgi:hypothetical protein